MLDRVVAWLLFGFGGLHLAFTPKVDPQFGMDGIWFASAGLLLMLVAAVNLLRVSYATIAPGVRVVSMVANLVLLLLIITVATRVPMRGNPQVPTSLALVGALSAFSLFRRNRT